MFKCDVERQRCKEFTRDERENYDKIYGAKLDEQFKKSTNPDADPKRGLITVEIFRHENKDGKIVKIDGAMN